MGAHPAGQVIAMLVATTTAVAADSCIPPAGVTLGTDDEELKRLFGRFTKGEQFGD
jgi:hypothetical protein